MCLTYLCENPSIGGIVGELYIKRPTRNFLVNLELTLVSGSFPSPQDGFFILYFEMATVFFLFFSFFS